MPLGLLYVVAPQLRKLVGDRKLIDFLREFPEQFWVTNTEAGCKRRNVLHVHRRTFAEVGSTDGATLDPRGPNAAHARFLLKQLGEALARRLMATEEPRPMPWVPSHRVGGRGWRTQRSGGGRSNRLRRRRRSRKSWPGRRLSCAPPLSRRATRFEPGPEWRSILLFNS